MNDIFNIDIIGRFDRIESDKQIFASVPLWNSFVNIAGKGERKENYGGWF